MSKPRAVLPPRGPDPGSGRPDPGSGSFAPVATPELSSGAGLTLLERRVDRGDLLVVQGLLELGTRYGVRGADVPHDLVDAVGLPHHEHRGASRRQRRLQLVDELVREGELVTVRAPHRCPDAGAA